VYSHETPASISFDPSLLAPGVGVDNSDVAVAAPSGGSSDTSNVVTAAEQEAQEGNSSLN
jgi:hypothetical protein